MGHNQNNYREEQAIIRSGKRLDRYFTVVKLAGNRDGMAMNILCEALKDADEEVRLAACEALKKTGEAAITSLCAMLEIERDSDVRAIVVDIVARVGTISTIPQLCAILRDEPNPESRQCIAMVLGRMGDIQATKPLCEVLQKEDNAHVRTSIADALGRIADTHATQALCTKLQEEDNSDVRKSLVNSLKIIKDTAAITPLCQMLQKERTADVRKGIVEALYPFMDTQVTVAFRRALHDPDAQVRKMAALGLERKQWTPDDELEKTYYLIAQQAWLSLLVCRFPQITPYLEMEHDPDEYIRKKIRDTLEAICASVSTVIFGEPDADVFTHHSQRGMVLVNPDVSTLAIPLTFVECVVIDAQTYDFHLAERFLTYAVNAIGQQYLKCTTTVHVYGNPHALHANLRNSVVNLCKHVYFHDTVDTHVAVHGVEQKANARAMHI